MSTYRLDLNQVSVVWNGSATYNVYYCGENVNCFTNYESTPDNWREIAESWLDEWFILPQSAVSPDGTLDQMV